MIIKEITKIKGNQRKIKGKSNESDPKQDLRSQIEENQDSKSKNKLIGSKRSENYEPKASFKSPIVVPIAIAKE